MWRLIIVGLPIFLASILSIGKQDKRETTVLWTISGIFLAVCVQVLLAGYGVLVPRGVVLTVFVAITLLFTTRVARIVLDDWRKSIGSVLITSTLFIGATLPWLYPMMEFPQTLFGAPFANSNNDLAIYIVSADNFINAGFAEFGRVVGYQAGQLANFEVAGSSSFITLVAHISGAPVWRIVTLAMLVVLVMTVIATFELGRTLNLPVVPALLAAIIGQLTPWSVTIAQNFFFSQAIARLALIAALLAIAKIARARSLHQNFCALVLVWASIWLSLVTYPSGSVVSLVFGALITPALLIRGSHERERAVGPELLRLMTYLALSVVLVVPFILDRLSLISSNISWYSQANITGWSARTDNFFDFLGISATVGDGFVTFWVGLAILGVMSLLAYVVAPQRTDVLSGFLLITGALLVFMIVGTRVGFSTYQTWKTLATVQFVVPVGLALIITPAASLLRSRMAAGASLAAVALLIVWNTNAASKTYRFATQLPTMELEIASSDRRLPRSELLIALNPYLETMIAPVILDVKNAIYATDTYLGPGSIDPQKCSLVRGRDESNSFRLSRSLQLTPADACVQP